MDVFVYFPLLWHPFSLSIQYQLIISGGEHDRKESERKTVFVCAALWYLWEIVIMSVHLPIDPERKHSP